MPADKIDLPKSVRYVKLVDEDGSVTELHYYRGCLHRIGAPAVIQQFSDGSYREQFWQHDRLHNESGPAWIDRQQDGSSHEAYYVNGELHRIGGPAVTTSMGGAVTEARHYRDGVWIKQPEQSTP